MDDNEERKVYKEVKAMVASYRYLEVSSPDLQMIGSNECGFLSVRHPGLISCR